MFSKMAVTPGALGKVRLMPVNDLYAVAPCPLKRRTHQQAVLKT